MTVASLAPEFLIKDGWSWLAMKLHQVRMVMVECNYDLPSQSLLCQQTKFGWSVSFRNDGKLMHFLLRVRVSYFMCTVLSVNGTVLLYRFWRHCCSHSGTQHFLTILICIGESYPDMFEARVTSENWFFFHVWVCRSHKIEVKTWDEMLDAPHITRDNPDDVLSHIVFAKILLYVWLLYQGVLQYVNNVLYTYIHSRIFVDLGLGPSWNDTHLNIIVGVITRASVVWGEFLCLIHAGELDILVRWWHGTATYFNCLYSNSSSLHFFVPFPSVLFHYFFHAFYSSLSQALKNFLFPQSFEWFYYRIPI